ncbi:MAG: hypothetical protein AAGA23_23145 [Pseudomonadota bacterium]
MITLITESDEIVLANPSITFTPDNWNQPQTIEITGVDDQIDDDAQPWVLRLLETESSDGEFAGVDPEDIAGINTDDDTAGVSIAPSDSLFTSEMGLAVSVAVVLDTQPVEPVSVSFVSSNTAEVVPEPVTMDFDASNWQTGQSLSLTGVDDDSVDDNAIVTITSLRRVWILNTMASQSTIWW